MPDDPYGTLPMFGNVPEIPPMQPSDNGNVKWTRWKSPVFTACIHCIERIIKKETVFASQPASWARVERGQRTFWCYAHAQEKRAQEWRQNPKGQP